MEAPTDQEGGPNPLALTLAKETLVVATEEAASQDKEPSSGRQIGLL